MDRGIAHDVKQSNQKVVPRAPGIRPTAAVWDRGVFGDSCEPFNHIDQEKDKTGLLSHSHSHSTLTPSHLERERETEGGDEIRM
jgi:hypothetical protein